jgi:hypothetical protein
MGNIFSKSNPINAPVYNLVELEQQFNNNWDKIANEIIMKNEISMHITELLISSKWTESELVKFTCLALRFNVDPGFIAKIIELVFLEGFSLYELDYESHIANGILKFISKNPNTCEKPSEAVLLAYQFKDFYPVTFRKECKHCDELGLNFNSINIKPAKK